MEGVQGYFERMTNGTLPGGVDPDYDYSEKAMEEKGNVEGRRRTKLINAFSYWSDQKDFSPNGAIRKTRPYLHMNLP